MKPGTGQTGVTSTIGAGIGGATTTGAGATTTGGGIGNPKLIPKRTPAVTVVIPTVARARIAIVFFIISKRLDALAGQNIVTTGLQFCKLIRRVGRIMTQ